MGSSRRTSNYLKKIVLFDSTHMMSMTDLVASGVGHAQGVEVHMSCMLSSTISKTTQELLSKLLGVTSPHTRGVFRSVSHHCLQGSRAFQFIFGESPIIVAKDIGCPPLHVATRARGPKEREFGHFPIPWPIWQPYDGEDPSDYA